MELKGQCKNATILQNASMIFYMCQKSVEINANKIPSEMHEYFETLQEVNKIEKIEVELSQNLTALPNRPPSPDYYAVEYTVNVHHAFKRHG